MSSGLFKMLPTKCFKIIYLIHMYKEDLALNNLQWLICHKTKPQQTNSGHISCIHAKFHCLT